MNRIFLLLLIVIPAVLSGQNEDDALRYSNLHFGGTARYNSMGGAFGALGGDPSVLSTNPAGLGVYRSSEFTFTPALYNQVSIATHYGNTVEDSKLNVNAGNFGFVLHFPTGNSTGWISTNLGIGYNRLADFHSQYTIEGVNNNSSLVDAFQKDVTANGGISSDFISTTPEFTFGTNLAWQAYLIDTLGSTTNYINAYQYNRSGKAVYGETQRNTITTRGRLGETALSFGANYNHRLYVGATIGVTGVYYKKNSNYSEILPEADTSTSLNQFTFTERLNTTGNGYNFKAGLIYRLHDWVRLGAAIHSPTYYSLSDTWSTDLSVEYDNFEESFTSPQGNYDYNLSTPFRAIGSAAFLFGKNGMISADYEYVNYNTARLSSQIGDYGFTDENQNVQNKFRPTGNIRVGGEWRVAPFTFRGGYSYYGNPYVAAVNNDGSRSSYSLGFGYREKHYYLDFAYVMMNQRKKLYLYDPELIEPSTISSYASSFLVTLGLKF